MKGEESSPGAKCKRTGNLTRCLSLKSSACIWMTNLCICPPFKKSFTSSETPEPGLWRLYISIHNWWPRPRQTAHYTCNMDSVLVSDACPRVDLNLSHHCVWSGNVEGMLYVYLRILCACLCVLEPKMEWTDLVFSSSSLAYVLTANSWFGFAVFCFLKYCFDFLHDVFWFTLFGSCAPKHLHNK